MKPFPNPLYDLPPDRRREELAKMNLRSLQDTLRQLDYNGWLTLEADEQEDRAVLTEAIISALENQ